MIQLFPKSTVQFVLTAKQQVTIGLACNGVFATSTTPISDCMNTNGTQGTVTSKLLKLPQGGYDAFTSQENDDHNPARVRPRNVLNLGIVTDNLFHSDGHRHYTESLDIANLTNVVAVYNFLSTFSGTHFLQPRTVVAYVGLAFEPITGQDSAIKDHLAPSCEKAA